MVYAGLIPLLVLAAPLPDDAVTISARIDADSLEVGRRYKIVLDMQFADGFSGGEAGVPAPILQIGVPDSVRLTGRVLKTHKELSRNEFMQAPFERLIEATPTTIGFKLLTVPTDNDRFALNVLAYVTDKNTKDSLFVRRRLLLPLSGGAKSEAVATTSSAWGIEDVLQIGDKADDFTLPTASGEKVSLSQYAGEKNVLVTTYRAFW